jgi:hypothetical protein
VGLATSCFLNVNANVCINEMQITGHLLVHVSSYVYKAVILLFIVAEQLTDPWCTSGMFKTRPYRPEEAKLNSSLMRHRLGRVEGYMRQVDVKQYQTHLKPDETKAIGGFGWLVSTWPMLLLFCHAGRGHVYGTACSGNQLLRSNCILGWQGEYWNVA